MTEIIPKFDYNRKYIHHYLLPNEIPTSFRGITDDNRIRVQYFVQGVRL